MMTPKIRDPKKERTKENDEPSDSSTLDEDSNASRRGKGSCKGRRGAKDDDDDDPSDDDFYKHGKRIPNRFTGKVRERFVKLSAKAREVL